MAPIGDHDGEATALAGDTGNQPGGDRPHHDADADVEQSPGAFVGEERRSSAAP